MHDTRITNLKWLAMNFGTGPRPFDSHLAMLISCLYFVALFEILEFNSCAPVEVFACPHVLSFLHGSESFVCVSLGECERYACTHACTRARTHLEDASTVMIANVINKKFVARDLENFGRHVLACSWRHGNQVANAVLVWHPWSSLRRLSSAGSNR
jgi:hypothetical protein